MSFLEGWIIVEKLEAYKKDLLDSRDVMSEDGTDSGNPGHSCWLETYIN